MFNRSSFNRTFFNRSFTVEVFGSVLMEGEGGLTAFGNMIATASGTLEGEGGLTAANIREIVNAALLEAEGGLTANNRRERNNSATMQGEGELIANAGRYHIETLTITGAFAPGQKIVIDNDHLTIRKDGVNILQQMTGDFIDLNLGDNVLTYRDTATGRNVLIRVTYRDKFA